MNPWKWLKDYFDLSRSERRGIAALLVLILLVAIIPFFIPYFFPSKKEDFSGMDKLASELIADSTAKKVADKKGDSAAINKSDILNKKIPGIEINTADSVQFASIPGIKPFLAARTIKFRKLLGGFYSKEQLLEVYGFPQAIYDEYNSSFSVKTGLVKKIKINSADMDELKHHPYIKYKLAKVIVKYRNQNGPFKNAEDLKKALDIDDQDVAKILPYISFE